MANLKHNRRRYYVKKYNIDDEFSYYTYGDSHSTNNKMFIHFFSRERGRPHLGWDNERYRFFVPRCSRRPIGPKVWIRAGWRINCYYVSKYEKLRNPRQVRYANPYKRKSSKKRIFRVAK